MNNQLQEEFGNIDIYLFDQLVKGTFDNCKRVIDIGCGGGRNIVYFLKKGFDVFGVDQQPEAIEQVRALSAALAPDNDTSNFRCETVESMSFDDGFFDVAICSAVLHFARDKNHFETMLYSIWRVLKPGGFLFARLASNIGIEKRVVPISDGRFFLPDGSERYLVDEHQLLQYTENLGAILFEPIKTTIVQNKRSMTTWCIAKTK